MGRQWVAEESGFADKLQKLQLQLQLYPGSEVMSGTDLSRYVLRYQLHHVAPWMQDT
jgi:hypothetical protein